MAWLSVPLETANCFYSWGLRGSIVGAVITAVSLIFLTWGTLIRDRNTERGTILLKKNAAAQETATAHALDEQKRLGEANAQLQSQIDKLRRAREISGQPASKMSSLLREHGSHSFMIVFPWMDPEAEILAQQIRGIFEAGSWKLIGQVQPQIDLIGPPRIGIDFAVKSQQNLPSALVPFINLMREEKLVGARANVGLLPELPDNESIGVFVGHKPSQ